MIYDKLNDTLHALPCKIRGLAVSTPQSADNEFLARADLRWATQAEIDAHNEAHTPETEAERAARLATTHGTQVGTLVHCLAQFTDVDGNPLSLPIELDDAISAMYAALETQPELTRHALLAQTIYTALHGAGLSDRDIYLISEVQA